MKKYFILICKTSNGVVYPSTLMCTAEDLQNSVNNFTNLGVTILDVKVFDFNPADYE